MSAVHRRCSPRHPARTPARGCTPPPAVQPSPRHHPQSDNTAGNLLLDQLGGPPAVTAFARAIADPVTRLDRRETALNSAVPGDERDTTSPAAIAAGYRELLLGQALGVVERERLRDWMLATATGARRVRAAMPPAWRVADKTGTGGYASANDVAVAWSPAGDPLVIAVLSSGTPPTPSPTPSPPTR
nr:serine hydrolase [Pseudonocardia lacus]